MLLMLAAAAIQVADDVALIFFRGDVFHLHDRLEQDRFALLESVLHRENRRHLERHFVGIDFVVAAVNDVDFDIDHRITAEHAVEHRFFDPFLARPGCIPCGIIAADDLVLDR